MARKFAAVVFSLGCVHTSSVLGLGLGEMTLGSYLNEPLNAQVDLLNVGGLHEDQIRVRLATTDDFKRMGVDRAYFLTSITFDVEIDDNGRARIVITSEDPVLEPYLDFIVEARWPSGRLLREYTVLVDPPVFDQSNPVISASRRVAEVDGEPEPAKKKSVTSSTSSTTGTRVDVRDSNLAPGEMPNRAFNSATSPAPVAGTRYMIHRDDTLWDIASSARPAGASVAQTMLDIQRMNPKAFIGGNINRIKAGYIVYLPDENDISSSDLSRALTEVRKQNEAWREGKTTEPDYSSGPSLRISAEPDEAAAGGSAASASMAANDAAMEDMEVAGLERVELEDRLSSMEQQVETLQRIVNLKDEQIAALQGALAEGETAADVEMPSTDAVGLDVLEGKIDDSSIEDSMPLEGEPELAVLETGEVIAAVPVEDVEEVAEVVVEEPAPTADTASSTAPQEDSPGFFSNLWFVFGAVVLAVLGFIFMRRRGGDDDDDTIELEPSPAGDVFADVELTEQPLEVEEEVEAAVLADELDEEGPVSSSRGYGERKHDEYASDEASDALAEAEIYIAYGRYPQAIDLLKNALGSDPVNAGYRLKLLQLYMETGNRTAAIAELSELESIGDADSIAAGQAALNGSAAQPVPRADFATDGGEKDIELLTDSDAGLESDFSGLEIEDPDTDTSLGDELDLSADFEEAEMASEAGEEDLVIAADSNGLSTKLDLARAYMDMGDDDGARQILEEVAAEGSEELQAEAKALLERIG
jgi:pilus assembly protein FimV